MTCVEEFASIIKPSIQGAIQTALPVMADHLCEWIYQMSWEKVYSYPAGEKCLNERRHQIGARKNLKVTIGEQTIEVKNITQLQFDQGPPEVEVVESGDPDYQQDFPGPRPFMQPAMDWFITVDADDDLKAALTATGFTVV